jgi:hypothetical protein
MDHQDWQVKLMDVFDQLDLDKSGSIDRSELLEACEEVGFPQIDAFDLFRTLDKSDNGAVDRIEWLHLIDEATSCDNADVELIVKFIERLAKRQLDNGRIYETDHTRSPILILRHDYPARMTWDISMMLLLFYISVTMPFSMGFGQHRTLETVDQVVDLLFCCDVILNFRTSYSDHDDTLVLNYKKIAWNYFKSWFFLDFFSSVPFDLVTAGFLPNMTPAFAEDRQNRKSVEAFATEQNVKDVSGLRTCREARGEVNQQAPPDSR